MIDFRTLDIAGAMLDVPNTWQRIKNKDGSIADERLPPYSLIREKDGIGVLQLSPALFPGGEPPNVTTAMLLNMAERLGRMRELGPSSNVDVLDSEHLLISMLSFHPRDKFIRLWYASDRLNFAFFSYGCNAGLESTELPDCEEMVRTLRFRTSTIPSA
jgi:hypothetical protein